MLHRGVGASLTRKEDERHLRGRGQFVADIALAGMHEVVLVRSPHANAFIRSITVPEAARRSVFTATELPRIKPIRVVTQAIGARSPPWPPLAIGKVRYVGDAIAACVARTRAEAEDLAAAIEVDYDVLPSVTDAELARTAGSPALIHESFGDNLYQDRTLAGGDIDAAARAAAVTISREFRTHRQSGAPMECRGVLAYREHRLDELVVYSATQAPHTLRVALGEFLGIEERCIRVVAPDVGGGFGSKARLYPEELILAALALELGHPVRWVETRSEHFLASVSPASPNRVDPVPPSTPPAARPSSPASRAARLVSCQMEAPSSWSACSLTARVWRRPCPRLRARNSASTPRAFQPGMAIPRSAPLGSARSHPAAS
jgi:carbon-monoxide dehydrogenase large subunit